MRYKRKKRNIAPRIERQKCAENSPGNPRKVHGLNTVLEGKRNIRTIMTVPTNHIEKGRGKGVQIPRCGSKKKTW